MPWPCNREYVLQLSIYNNIDRGHRFENYYLSSLECAHNRSQILLLLGSFIKLVVVDKLTFKNVKR